MNKITDGLIETLGEDGEFSVLRVKEGGELPPCILVTPSSDLPKPASLKKLEHAYSLRDELDPSWAAKPLSLVQYRGKPALLLHDRGGALLTNFVGRDLGVKQALRFAVGIAGAVANLHARGFIHRDIKPANILLNAATGETWLTGLGSISRLNRQRATAEAPRPLHRTFAYVAPEQTGQMNRSVDSRSDLYSLGILLYEIFVGEPPFAAEEPMELIHCHIARLPAKPSAKKPELPEPVCAIVMKLLAKSPEERYQTAAGLESDLRHCFTVLDANDRIEDFPKGTADVPLRLPIPDRLYGRDREIELLRSAFDRVVRTGGVEMVLVSGHSGVGKSSVVNELRAVVAPLEAFFASGKFDQYKRDSPYATLAQAFQQLIRQILAKSNTELARHRDFLLEALGMNGQLVVNLVPELELVIGKQPILPELPPQDEKRRFQMVFRRFVGAFARPGHSLALFLDDLQWLDPATLDLLEHLLAHDEVKNLLVIGAYRDNEVGPSHPLAETLVKIRNIGTPVSHLSLKTLVPEDVTQLLADTFHCRSQRAESLARAVHEKTGGNPLFVIQFLSVLTEDGSIFFDPAKARWHWHINRIRAKRNSENVVDLLIEELGRLPATELSALKQLACLGNGAQIETLTAVFGMSPEAVHATLRESGRNGLVSRSGDGYSFVHDRIREAAYATLSESERARAHLQIARTLESRYSAARIEENVFEIVHHFSLASSLVIAQEERDRVAELNFIAAKRAQSSTAYISALVYLSAAIELLSPDRWDRHYDLTFALTLHRAECELLTAKFAIAQLLIQELLERSKTKFDSAAVYRLKIELHLIQSDNDLAVKAALEGLRLFGLCVEPHPTRAELDLALDDVWRAVAGRKIETLIDLPKATDPGVKATLEILCALYAPAFFTDENLTGLDICCTIRLSLERGINGASAHAFGLFGTMLGHLFGRYTDGFRFAKLAVELGRKHRLLAYEAKILKTMEEASIWTHPIAFALNSIRSAIQSANQSGDIPVACYALNHVVTDLLLRGDHLDHVWDETERALDFVRTAKFCDLVDTVISQQRFVQRVRGRTISSCTFDGDGFEEARFEEQLTAARNQTMVCWYWIIKGKACFLFGDYEAAADALKRAGPILWASQGRIQCLDFHLFSALTQTTARAPGPWSTKCRAKLDAHYRYLALWAETNPQTFADKYLLVTAEIARIEGRELDAERLYEEAIQSAQQNGFIHDEAMANELAARFYANRGLQTIAHAYLRNARSAYFRWGALGKVKQLIELYPHLRPETPAIPLTASIDQIDFAAVMKMSQAVSGELIQERLIERLLAIAVEYAGAARGLLLLPYNGDMRIEAEALAEEDAVRVNLHRESTKSAKLPEAVLHYATRSQKSLLLDDAANTEPFTTDEYIQRKRSRSILCIPLLKQGNVTGVLYLENDLVSHAFTPHRSELLQLLASQAAISLENSRLYRDLQEAEQKASLNARELRLAIETIPSLVWNALPDGSNETFSRQWHDYTGIEPERARNGGWKASYHPDDLDKVVAKWTQMLKLGIAGGVEARVRRFDGEYRCFLIRGMPLLDESGSVTKWYGTSTDIEDLKRAEDKLRRSEAFLAQAQRLTKTGSLWWRVATGQIVWSEESYRLLDYPISITPTVDLIMQRCHPDDLQLVRRMVARSALEGTDMDFEHRLLMPDKSIKHIHVLVQYVGLHSGKPEFIGAVTDITERKRAEEELRKAQVELAHVTRVTTMGELAASIAHEVSQPISGVIINATTSLRWLKGLPADFPDLCRAREAIERAIRDGRRAGDIVSRIRQIFKKAETLKEPLDLNEAVRDVLILTRSELEKRRVALVLELSDRLPEVIGDRVQLQQVMLNLILNAIEAMSTVDEQRRQLIVRTQIHERTKILVTVRDTGPGLDSESMEKVFVAFHTTKPSGLGMGLSISRSIIENHSGRLWVTPNGGPGACFEFALPAYLGPTNSEHRT